MIARVWRGWTSTQDADDYDQHYRLDVVPSLRQISGFRSARLLRRSSGGETEFVSVTQFDSLDAIRAFAGEEYDVAVVSDAARRVLVRFDTRVVHYDVAVEV